MAGRSSASKRLRAWVLKTQDFCSVCGGLVDKTLSGKVPDGPTLEHPHALHDGGDELDPRNARLAHLRCNVAKENRQRAVRRRRPVAPTPSREW